MCNESYHAHGLCTTETIIKLKSFTLIATKNSEYVMNNESYHVSVHDRNHYQSEVMHSHSNTAEAKSAASREHAQQKGRTKETSESIECMDLYSWNDK